MMDNQIVNQANIYPNQQEEEGGIFNRQTHNYAYPTPHPNICPSKPSNPPSQPLPFLPSSYPYLSIRKSLLEDGHHILLQLLPRKTLELRPLRNALPHKLLPVLSLILQAVGRRGVLLGRFAAGLHRHAPLGLPVEVLAVDGLLGVVHGEEYLVAGWGEGYSLWMMGRQASPESMVLTL